MADVQLRDVTKVHTDGTRAVTHLDLAVDDGELLALVGPSGSGKTTVLRLVAGLDDPTSGSIRIGGRDVDGLTPRDRDVALVSQDYGLYPHLDVAGNLAFPLQLRHVPAQEASARVEAEARARGLSRLLRRKPRQLAAGERQSVALGRATARTPQVFCLDEPLSQLDPRERARMRADLVRLQRGLGVTTLYVTNDSSEAMAVGDRMAVLRTGTLEQIGDPQGIYDRPSSAFVAAFVGGATLFAARVEVDDGVFWLAFGRHRLRFAGSPPFGAVPDGTPVVVGLRPDQLYDARLADRFPDDRRLHAPAIRLERLGAAALLIVDLDATPVSFAEEPQPVSAPRTRARVKLPGDTDLVVGQEVELAVDLRGAQYFDPATGWVL